MAVIALALLAAACGDDGDDGDNAAATTEAGGSDTTTEAPGGNLACGLGNGEEATGEPINVGAIVGVTGPADLSNSANGAAAFFDCVNANGGINGRPVNYLVEDDTWTPDVSAQVAASLVEDENVVALVGGFSFVACGVNAGYYEEQNVLDIPGVGVPRECFHSRSIAPTNQGPRLSGIGAAEFAREEGHDKIACIANVIPNFGGWVCEGVEAWGAENGVEVETFLGAPDASDAETVTLQALGSNPDAVVLVDAAPSMVPYIRVLEQQGGDVPLYLPTSAYELTFPDAIGSFWDENLDIQIELAPLDSEGPDNTLWQSVMDTYAAADAPRDSFSQAGFLAAKIFTDTLLELDPEAIDRAAVTEALRAVEDYETDLLCSPWYFGDGDRHQPNHAGRIVQQVADGIRFEVIKECHEVPDPELEDVLAAEG